MERKVEAETFRGAALLPLPDVDESVSTGNARVRRLARPDSNNHPSSGPSWIGAPGLVPCSALQGSAGFSLYLQYRRASTASRQVRDPEHLRWFLS